MRLMALVDRIMHRHAPPEQPHTGRVCAKCLKHIGRNDKFKQLAVAHDDCRYPQGAPQLPGKLARLIEEGQ